MEKFKNTDNMQTNKPTRNLTHNDSTAQMKPELPELKDNPSMGSSSKPSDTLNKPSDTLKSETKENIKKNMDETLHTYSREFYRMKDSLNRTMNEIGESLKNIGMKSVENLGENKEYVERLSKTYLKKIDQKAHQRPWTMMGIMFVSSLFLGVYLGKKWEGKDTTHRP